MAASKAIIATAEDHAVEVIRDGHNGVLVESGDVSKFAEAMLNLINDPAARGRLGKNARQQAVELYSWEQYTRRLEDIYLNILGNASSAPSGF
jgi:glycosyltransferase involved in cell wall biosynthesis